MFREYCGGVWLGRELLLAPLPLPVSVRHPSRGFTRCPPFFFFSFWGGIRAVSGLGRW